MKYKTFFIIFKGFQLSKIISYPLRPSRFTSMRTIKDF